ncbi:MAG: hypothetical protein ACLR8Y_19775 [Alistipes indistinctus]
MNPFTLGNRIKGAVSGVEGIADLNVEQQVERPQLQIKTCCEMLARVTASHCRNFRNSSKWRWPAG